MESQKGWVSPDRTPYQRPVVLDIRKAVTKAKREFSKIPDMDHSFEDIVRDVLAFVAIDSSTSEGVAHLKNMYDIYCSDMPEASEFFHKAIDILSQAVLEELRFHRVYDELGALNYQFSQWLEDATMLLVPIKKIESN